VGENGGGAERSEVLYWYAGEKVLPEREAGQAERELTIAPAHRDDGAPLLLT
jgi:hypothetical protein